MQQSDAANAADYLLVIGVAAPRPNAVVSCPDSYNVRACNGMERGHQRDARPGGIPQKESEPRAWAEFLVACRALTRVPQGGIKL